MKYKGLWIGCGGLLVFMFMIGLFLVGQYNGLVSQYTKVQTAQSNIDSALQRRYDLIPNVVNSVKGYMQHESSVFNQIAEARAKIGSGSAVEQEQVQSELSSAVGRLLMLTENYPELKSNESVNALIVELEGSENRIYVARNDFNTIAANYNQLVRSFPTVIFANMFGYKEVTLFNTTPAAQTVPTVDLNVNP